MIWHFFEVWGLLVVAFAVGCLLGTLLYMGIAASPLADAQLAAAESIAGGLGGFRRRADRRRVSGGYRRPAEPQPHALLAPEGYAAAPLIQGIDHEDPVEDGGGVIDRSLEPPAAEWEEAYWDEGPEDFRAPESAAPSLGLPPERLLPERSAEATLPQEPEPRPALPAMRPLTLSAPRNGVPDNLQRIRGIGQKNEELLNSLGIFHFGQIAAWTPAEARWVAGHLAFPERIERDDWIGQAIILATGGDTGYVKAADRRKGGEDPPVAA